MPTETNLLADYDSFADLEAACEAWCERVNARPHRATGQPPVERLMREGPRLHVLPDNPHLLALGEERLVGTDQTVSWGNVRYSTPDGHQGRRVWCRVSGDELVIGACTGCGLAEIARHRLSTPGNPRIVDEHYPHHPDGGSVLRMPKPRPRTEAEIDFLMLGEGASRWLTEAAATGVARIRRKMNQAVELAHVLGDERVDTALAVAAQAGRFDDGDLVSILDHLTDANTGTSNVVAINETHSAQPGTGPWRRLGA